LVNLQFSIYFFGLLLKLGIFNLLYLPFNKLNIKFYIFLLFLIIWRLLLFIWIILIWRLYLFRNNPWRIRNILKILLHFFYPILLHLVLLLFFDCIQSFWKNIFLFKIFFKKFLRFSGAFVFLYLFFNKIRR
jgi:hypothetical protein